MGLISLSASEMLAAGNLGMMTFIKAVTKDLHPRYHADVKDHLYNQMIGRFGEIAVAKFLNRHMSFDLNAFKDADVSDDVQVRTTSYNRGHLILWDKDHSDHLYVLVSGGALPKMQILGAIRGRDGKNKKYWNPNQSNYWIPQSDLYELLKSGEIKEREISDANQNG